MPDPEWAERAAASLGREYAHIAREAEEWLKHKCRWEQRTRGAVLSEWGLSPALEAFMGAIILREFGSENLRRLEKYPEMVKALRQARPVLLGLVDGMDHDDPECTGDDTCRCENTRRANAACNALEAALRGEPEEGV